MESDLFLGQLKENKKKLEECQKKSGVKSCFTCDKIFECKIRSEYVVSVYKSMNKGVDGGFEF